MISEKVTVLVIQSCHALCNSMDCSPPGSSVQEISQARLLEWAAVSSSRGSSRLRGRALVSCITGRFFCYLSHQGSWSLSQTGWSWWGCYRQRQPSRASVLVCLGYRKETSQAAWLKQQKFISHSYGSQEVQGQGASRFGFWWGLVDDYLLAGFSDGLSPELVEREQTSSSVSSY